MKRTFVAGNLVVVLMVAALALGGCSDSGKQAKKIEHLKGIILFQVGLVSIKNPGADFIPATMSSTVTAGDVIKTGGDSQVTLQVSDIAVVQILENSVVEIKSLFGEGAGKLYTEEGQVLAKMNKLKKGDSFNVQTPTAVASVRGTEFLAGNRKGKSVFAVKEGKVAVRMQAPAPAAADKPAVKDGAKPAPVQEKFVGEEVVLEKGKAAEITVKDVAKAVEHEKKVEVLKKEGKTAEIAKLEKPKTEVREITKSEELTVEKISIVAMVEKPEEKTPQQLQDLHKKVIQEEKKLEDRIKVEVRKEQIQVLIQKKDKTEADIKEVFSRIDEIALYNGRVLRGAIITRGAVYSVLTTDGAVTVPEDQIKSVRVIR